MILSDYLAQAEALARDCRALLDSLDPATRLDVAKGQLNALKDDRLNALQGALRALPAEDRRAAGSAFNSLKTAIQDALDAFAARLAAASGTEQVDLTMPGRRSWRGAVHPVTLVIDEICDIFRELGFTVALGPEAETEWYNFGALNFPADHPAMELHDTLYLGEDTLLRTHTSPVQVRTMQRYAPPIRVLAPGQVYRRDFFDATHAPAFMQLEGLAIDEGVSFVDLKATLAEFARRFYGATRRVRFGPSYFPFVEPGAQMDVEVDLGDGKGLRWVEILGCGMVHPNVIESAGLDSERYTGWAFGMGPARIAMSRYGINDIRVLYDSDVRFLEQFAR
ncbi:phenylalanine--tRNA ligase subunit alpha [Gemmatimonas sp. UBA7669]|uniref:phenylalanine--tRNA ligase subunit alpha n=1 Tax=Gemmatimonas sp. UBA7669 TaxID=1946568 RepID=UPI0025BD8A72|nr:phenylalanine--tRNA ligase subunit alpha [Gemmatimonas sp. UBA7669]